MDDNRKSQRHTKRLRAVMIREGMGESGKTHGKTLDLSATGASIISEYNLRSSQMITICLLIHPGDQTHPPVIFEAKAKVSSSILSPQQGGFRIGVEFLKIEGDGMKMLQKYLSSNMAPTA